MQKSIYQPDGKHLSNLQSLADELRECGILSDDDPLSEPRAICPNSYVFKVVFVGDSAVGKTSFLQRLCYNQFKPVFNATIGVDYTVKTFHLDHCVVALQLWDTAGQERFRSITKQYFRRADGVILMFDVTSEQSFLNVRNWITSVKADVEETCMLCLVGNKIDLRTKNRSKLLTYKHGKKLAEEFDMSFFETSACTGFGVEECMRAIAIQLQERKEQLANDGLKFEMIVQRKDENEKWCCF